MLFFRNQSLLFHVKVVFILSYLFDTLTGNGLQEVWIQTTADDAIRLKNYQLTYYQDNQLNFSIRMNTIDCKLSVDIVLLDLDTSDDDVYSMIIFSLNPDKIHVYLTYLSRGPQEKIFECGPILDTCEEFIEFRISWSNQVLAIFNSFNSTAFTVSNLPTSFQVQNVAVAVWDSDADESAVFRIKHSGVFTGYYCGKEQTYGAMDLLTSTTRSEIMCAAMCGKTEDCLGMNYNDQTKQCELIRSGQLVVKEPRQGWKFSTKCLNGKEMCLACF